MDYRTDGVKKRKAVQNTNVRKKPNIAEDVLRYNIFASAVLIGIQRCVRQPTVVHETSMWSFLNCY